MDNRTWFEKLKTRFWKWLANRLPDRLVYFAVVRAWTYATTQDGGRVPTVHERTTMSRALYLWRIRGRDEF